VLEAGELERLVPLEDPLLEVRDPLRRRRGIDVPDPRLHRLDELAAGERFRVLWLEAVAADVALRADALVITRIVGPADRAVADPLVPEAGHHRLLREEDHRVVDLKGERAAPRVRRRPVGRVGLDDADLDVDREAPRPLEPA